jgi:hypothetical protein
MTMAKDPNKIDEAAEYYDTHDITAEMDGAEWTRHEPAPASEQMIVTSVRLPRSVHARLREIAGARGIKPTALMRAWIEERLTSEPSVTRAAHQLGARVVVTDEETLHRIVREELRDAGLAF